MTSLPKHPRPLKVTDVNPHLLCVLCGGYYVDATTIIECLHSFCKSCIVRYLETNKYCPICDVQVHKSKPLLNIRSDRTLQTIVYKLVPGLFQRELNCRREFYNKYPEYKPSVGEDAGELTEDSPIYLPNEQILLGVQYAGPSSTTKVHDKRYLRCPAAITIYHLQKLMRAKFNLNATQKVEFFHGGDSLPEYLSLIDLAYMYHWKRKHPVELEYQILECHQKKIKLCLEENNSVSEKNRTNILECENSGTLRDNTTDQPDREVQLQISENGVISVHSVNFNTSLVNNTVISSKVDDNKPVSDSPLPMKNIEPEAIELMKSLEKTVTLDFDSSFTGNVEESVFSQPVKQTRTCSNVSETDKIFEINSNTISSIDNTKKGTIIEKKCNTQDNLNNSVVSNIPSVHISNTCITVQKVYPGAVKDISNSSKSFEIKELRVDTKEHEIHLKPPSRLKEKHDSTKPPNHIRYKTLKTPIKPWNPSIPRSSLLAMKQATSQDKSDSAGKATPKAPKFFKMRNVPRFLGNPSSGVKPMYQVLPRSELSTQVPQGSSSQSSKHTNEITIMKIDPKTLNPIPVSRSAQTPKLTSPPNKLSSSFSPDSLKSTESHLHSANKPKRNPKNKSNNISFKISGQVHNASLTSNPFILPSPHVSHMMYSGYPRPYPSVESSGNRLPSDSHIFRAMSMLCSPNTGFHPSLPPSISMLFNPHHPHHRSQNEKINLKYTQSDFHKSAATTTPSVQRIPPSCPTSKHSTAPSHSPIAANDMNNSVFSGHDHTSNKLTAKLHVNEGHVKTKETQLPNSSPTTSTSEKKSNDGTSMLKSDDQLQSSIVDGNSVPLSNGFTVALPKCAVDSACGISSSKNKEDKDYKSHIKTDFVGQIGNE